MKTGIYKIENLINHKVYIGQATNIDRRWADHKRRAFDSLDHSYDTHLYRSIRKYGLENFEFSIIELCNVEDLNNREIYWVEYYNSFFEGYNLTLGGDSSVGQKHSKEKIIGIIHDLETTDLIHKDIAEKWNISVEMVQGINTGRYWRHNRQYPIQHRTQILAQQRTDAKNRKCCDCGKSISKGATRCRTCDNKFKALIQPSKKSLVTREELKQLIRSVPFTKIGEKYGVSDNAIRRWCDSYNLPKTKTLIKKYTDEEWANI